MKKPLKQAWLLTLSDLMTLVLCFFVMLFAMSTPKQNKYFQTTIGFEKTSLNSSVSLIHNGGVDLEYLAQILKQRDILQNFTILYPDRLVLDISSKQIDKMPYLIQTLNNIDNQIEIRILSPSSLEESALKGMAIINTLKALGLKYSLPLVIKKAPKEKIQIIIFQYDKGVNNAY